MAELFHADERACRSCRRFSALLRTLNLTLQVRGSVISIPDVQFRTFYGNAWLQSCRCRICTNFSSVYFVICCLYLSGCVNGWRPWLPAGRLIWHSDTSLADTVALCPPYLWRLQQRGIPVELNWIVSTYILFDIDNDKQSCGSFFAWIRTCVWHRILL